MEIKPVSYTKHAIKGFGWLTGGAILQSFLQITTLAVLARLLHPSDFGVLNVIMILVGFSTIFVDIGIGAALVQMKEMTPRHIYNGYVISLLLGVLIAGFFYIMAPYLAIYFKIESVTSVVRIFALYFPLRSLSIVPESLLQRALKFKVTVSIQNISYLIGFGLIAIVSAYNGAGYWSLVYAQFGQLIVSTILLCWNQRVSFREKLDLKIAKSLLFFGGGYSLSTIFNYFAENGDNMTVGRVLGPVQLGLYGRAFQLFSLPARFFGIIFDKVFFPLLSRKREEKEVLNKVYMSSLMICHIILMPLSAFLIVLAPELITLLLGKGWEQVILPFQILAAGLSCRFGTKINKSFIKSLGIVYKGALYQFIFCVLIIGFSFAGASIKGLIGVATGVFAATVINYVQTMLLICKNIKSHLLHVVKIHFITTIFFILITVLLGLCVVAQRVYISHFYLIIGITFIFFLPFAALLILFVSKRFLNADYSFIVDKVVSESTIATKFKRFI